MDPRMDPDFVPPSDIGPDWPKERNMSSSYIPDAGPITSFMGSAESTLDPPQDDEDNDDNPGWFERQATLAGQPGGIDQLRQDQEDTQIPPEAVPIDVSDTQLPQRKNSNKSTHSNSSCGSEPTPPLGDIPTGIPRNPQGSGEPRFVVPEIHEPEYRNTANLEEVPGDVVRQATKLEDYAFPAHRLATELKDESKSPLVLVACGSFSPITYLHLRMFEMAIDAVRDLTRFEVIGGYYSPVSDHYKKAGLADSQHRVRMCELACERTSSWLMVDAWESLQPSYSRTALVLDHFNNEINVKRRGIGTSEGKRRGVKIMLLAGGDLIESMGEPNVWLDSDLHHILGRYGCMIVERTGSDVRNFLLSHDILYEHRHNVMVIKQLIYNDISSTKVRLFIRRNMSVQYLVPSSVIRYIYEHALYLESEPVKEVMRERGD